MKWAPFRKIGRSHNSRKNNELQIFPQNSLQLSTDCSQERSIVEEHSATYFTQLKNIYQWKIYVNFKNSCSRDKSLMIGNVTCGCSRKGGNKDEGVYFSLTKDYSNCIYNKFLYMYLCTYRLQMKNRLTAGQWSNSGTKTLHMGNDIWRGHISRAGWGETESSDSEKGWAPGAVEIFSGEGERRAGRDSPWLMKVFRSE